MKVRDSAMPDRAYWESLFDIPGILDRLSLDGSVGDVIEVGCGYGTFSLPIAQRISGTLYAFDIELEMVEATRKRTEQAGVKNIRFEARDVVAAGFGVAPGSIDVVLLFNILHAEQPMDMIRTANHALRSGGRILAIHWRSDVETPRGPDPGIRPRPENIREWGNAVGLVADPAVLLPPWHFGIVLHR